MVSASEWAAPPTRTELIENLVSGVGEYLVCPSHLVWLQSNTYEQTDTTQTMLVSLRTTSIIRSEAKSMTA